MNAVDFDFIVFENNVHRVPDFQRSNPDVSSENEIKPAINHKIQSARIGCACSIVTGVELLLHRAKPRFAVCSLALIYMTHYDINEQILTLLTRFLHQNLETLLRLVLLQLRLTQSSSESDVRCASNVTHPDLATFCVQHSFI